MAYRKCEAKAPRSPKNEHRASTRPPRAALSVKPAQITQKQLGKVLAVLVGIVDRQ
jgi:hypothetical protein